jgi:hypothetical protein
MDTYALRHEGGHPPYRGVTTTLLGRDTYATSNREVLTAGTLAPRHDGTGGHLCSALLALAAP